MVENETLEAAPIEAAAPEQESPETNVQPSPVPKTAPAVETQAQMNFRLMEEKMRRLERERDEALRLAQQTTAPKAPVAQEVEEDFHIGDDEIAEGKHISKLDKKLNNKIAKLEAELRQYQKAATTLSDEAMIKAQYPDVEKVVSKENIELLRTMDPEFAEAIAASTNDRARVIAAYKQIKKLGIYADDPAQAERELALKNAQKPKPLASIAPQQGDSPLSRANAFANGLTPELKASLWKEIEDSRRNL